MGKKKLGLALGSGGARGSAHVGVLKVLEEEGLSPDVIVGTSMGAEIGGAYAAGVGVEKLSTIWQSMTFGKVAKVLLPTIPWSGWSSGGEVLRTLRTLVEDASIEDLPISFAAVATDLQTGLPYRITSGPLAEAVRASVSVPGLFTPVWLDGHLLIDGGVSDPLPVDVAKELGADVVVAVDVLVCPDEGHISGIPVPEYRERILGIVKKMEGSDGNGRGTRRFYPSVFTVLFQMSTVFQKRICDLSLQVHVPDVLIRPDFAEPPPCYSDVRDGIQAGETAARAALPAIERALRS